VLAAFFMSSSYHDETRELHELTRKELSGSFIELPGGVTHYELSNPEQENTVILVHGFSVPYFIFDPTFEFLKGSGFRVARYDLFGRGFSDRPDTRYNIDLFVNQLGDLLDALGFTRPVSLVGLSTGGPITATFTARFPERVNKLVLIDPIGARILGFARILKVAAMPVVGEAIISLFRSDGIAKNFASALLDRELVGQFQARYLAQMQYKGFKRGILSSIRNGMLDSFLKTYERLGKMDKPVLLFWGRNDPTVPFKHSHDLRAAMPSLEFHVIENCGHIPHYEKPEEVNPILLDFLRK
jgi:pimeloyl-ACP methyl ester carboxylesterase